MLALARVLATIAAAVVGARAWWRRRALLRRMWALERARRVHDRASNRLAEALADAGFPAFYADTVVDYRGEPWGWAPVYQWETGRVVHVEGRVAWRYCADPGGGARFDHLSSLGEVVMELGGGLVVFGERGYDGPSILRIVSTARRNDMRVSDAARAEADEWAARVRRAS